MGTGIDPHSLGVYLAMMEQQRARERAREGNPAPPRVVPSERLDAHPTLTPGFYPTFIPAKGTRRETWRWLRDWSGIAAQGLVLLALAALALAYGVPR